MARPGYSLDVSYCARRLQRNHECLDLDPSKKRSRKRSKGKTWLFFQRVSSVSLSPFEGRHGRDLYSFGQLLFMVK